MSRLFLWDLSYHAEFNTTLTPIFPSSSLLDSIPRYEAIYIGAMAKAAHGLVPGVVRVRLDMGIVTTSLLKTEQTLFNKSFDNERSRWSYIASVCLYLNIEDHFY